MGKYMFTKKLGYLASTAMVATLALSSNAYAQFEDEIIVTATKRETTLQATPVAVSVTGADTIEKARILDLNDLQSVVPSLRVNQLQSSQNTNFVIRGFGNGANNAGIEPSVGVFIDGVYRSRSAAQIGDLPKLSRIEVLRGPQSTLFGKNASAGVVSIITAAPSFEPTGYVEAGYGNYNNFTGRAYVSGALNEKMAFSLGGGFNKRDGYVESNDPTLQDVNDRDRWNVRGQLLVEPTDMTSVRIIADISGIDENCCAVTNIQNEGVGALLPLFGAQTADANDPFARVAFQNKDSLNTLDDYGVSAHVDHDFGNIALTSISSYRRNESFFDTDADYGTIRILDGVSSDQQISTYTQELRLASVGQNKLDWMVGGYLFHEDVNQISGLEFGDDVQPLFNTLLELGTGIPGLLTIAEGVFGAAPGTFLGGQVETTETFNQENTAWSLFGSADFHVNDQLTFSGGLNYTSDKKTVSGGTVNNDVFSSIDLFTDPTLLGIPYRDVIFGAIFQAQTGFPATPTNFGIVEGLFPGTLAAVGAGADAVTAGVQTTQFQPQFVNFPNSVEDGKSDDSKLTWNVRAAYEVNDSINVYASASTGFKSSSWNLSRDSRPFAADAGALGMAALLQGNQTFGTRFAAPEEATVFELGLKARFSKGAINIAVFDQKIEGFQSNTFLGTGFSLSNAGEQSTQGVEVDLTYSPVDALTLSVAGTFLDPVYDSFVNGPGPGGTVADLSGQTPAGIPSTSLSVGALYDHDFGNGTTGFLRGDWQYESEVQSNEAIDFSTGAEQPFRTVSIFNASTGVSFDNGISVNVWARNLFDSTYITTVFPGVAQAGIINGYLNAPRTYGVNLRKSW
jgi:outer membrane receptor protein involved in Fe transport